MNKPVKILGIGSLIETILHLLEAIVPLLEEVLKSREKKKAEKNQKKLAREAQREENKAQHKEKKDQLQAEREKKSKQNRFMNFCEWSRKERFAFYNNSLAEINQNYKGQIKRVLIRKEQTVELRATMFNRPANILLDSASGAVELRMKFINKRGTLMLIHDKSKQRSNYQNPRDEHWDDPDEEVIHVFVPEVYTREKYNRIHLKIALIEDLSVYLRETMFAWLLNKNASSIMISEDLVSVCLGQPFYLMQSPQEIFDEAFAWMHDIASHFSKSP